MIVLILWVAAFIIFVISAASVPVPRVNLIGLGLALATLAYIMSSVVK